MKKWEQFEIDSTNYLNKVYKNHAVFTRQGGADSTLPDIKVQTNSGKCYYIEAKHCPAQCGQFVLIPNLKTLTFDYSSKNESEINEYSEKIISFMNNDFETFKEAGTSGKAIIFDNDQNIFNAWIVDNYKSKGVKYIITNDYKILPIDDFKKAFIVSAKYRIKRSGSNNVGKSNINTVKNHLINNYNISSCIEDKGKLFIKSTENLHNCRFIINGTEYMISSRENKYEIRKLSNTFNANVIFSIVLNPSYSFSEKVDFT